LASVQNDLAIGKRAGVGREVEKRLARGGRAGDAGWQ